MADQILDDFDKRANSEPREASEPAPRLFIPRTPSGFHDESWKRLRATPKHDVMQAEVLHFLRNRVLAGLPERSFVDRMVEGEYPIEKRGQIIAYVDAIEITTIDFRTTVQAFEIKPVIETVFGIVRQAKALLPLLRVAIPGVDHFVHIVVPANDPKIAELRTEWPHTWAWGATFEETQGDD